MIPAFPLSWEQARIIATAIGVSSEGVQRFSLSSDERRLAAFFACFEAGFGGEFLWAVLPGFLAFDELLAFDPKLFEWRDLPALTTTFSEAGESTGRWIEMVRPATS